MMSVAYRMLGSVTDAEDAVQDAFVHLQTAGDVTSPEGFLIRTTTRLCIDRLRAVRRRKEYVGPWVPEPVDTKDGARDSALAESLTQAFLLKIREAAAQPQRDELERWLAEARALGVSPTRVAAAMRAAPPAATAQPTMTQPEQLAPQPVADRNNDGRPLDPSQGSALANPNAPRQRPPSELKRTRYVTPEYPKDALKRDIGGEVRVRFTLDADGKVKSAEVVNSSPADVFDRAALDAVRRWRFKPLAAGNPDFEATVVTSIVFRPDDARTP
jgi:TonB family protein